MQATTSLNNNKSHSFVWRKHFLGQFNSFYALIKIKPHFDTQNFGCHFQLEILNGLNEMGHNFFSFGRGLWIWIGGLYVLFKKGVHLIDTSGSFVTYKTKKTCIIHRWNGERDHWLWLKKKSNECIDFQTCQSCRQPHVFSSDFYVRWVKFSGK